MSRCRYCQGRVSQDGKGFVCEKCGRWMIVNFHGKLIELPDGRPPSKAWLSSLRLRQAFDKGKT